MISMNAIIWGEFISEGQATYRYSFINWSDVCVHLFGNNVMYCLLEEKINHLSLSISSDDWGSEMPV